MHESLRKKQLRKLECDPNAVIFRDAHCTSDFNLNIIRKPDSVIY